MRVSKDPSQSDEVLNNRHCLHFDAKLYTNTLNSQNFDHIFWKKSVFHFTSDSLDRNIQHQRTMSMYKGRTVRHQNLTETYVPRDVIRVKFCRGHGNMITWFWFGRHLSYFLNKFQNFSILPGMNFNRCRKKRRIQSKNVAMSLRKTCLKKLASPDCFVAKTKSTFHSNPLVLKSWLEWLKCKTERN